MGLRHHTRQLAVQALYALDSNPEIAPLDAAKAAWDEAESPGDRERLEALVEGAWTRRVEIDKVIEEASRNWKLSRMDRVDRCILRLGVFELMGDASVPAPVIISEAVELAKEFGSGDSPAFINGLLDHIARAVRAEEVRSR